MNISNSIDRKQRIEMRMLGQKGIGVGIANPVGSYPPELVLWVLLLQKWGGGAVILEPKYLQIFK